MFLFLFLYRKKDYWFSLNSESTNCFLLNSCRFSIPSPSPMYLTGTFNWSEIPITTPPLAVPSSFVIAKEVICVTAENCFACSKAF